MHFVADDDDNGESKSNALLWMFTKRLETVTLSLAHFWLPTQTHSLDPLTHLVYCISNHLKHYRPSTRLVFDAL